MPTILQELQAIATAGGLHIKWQARRDGDGVKVACNCGRYDGANPTWVSARAWPIDQLAGAIDDAASMAVGYWGWMNRKHRPGG